MGSSKALKHISFRPMKLNEVVFDVSDAPKTNLGFIILIKVWP